MIKKRKNIDITPEVLKVITLQAVDKGVSPKKLIETIIENYVRRNGKDVLK